MTQEQFDNLNLKAWAEMPVRDPRADELVANTKSLVRKVFSIPKSHRIFFNLGGGHEGFRATAVNLRPGHLVTTGSGQWSAIAKKEIQEWAKTWTSSFII